LAAATSEGSKEEGILDVAADKLTFTWAGGKLEIPVAAILGLVPRRRFTLFDVNEWAVIECRLAGKDLVAAFKPAALRERTRHEDIVGAIRGVLSR
jgi:hypothetical protein